MTLAQTNTRNTTKGWILSTPTTNSSPQSDNHLSLLLIYLATMITQKVPP